MSGNERIAQWFDRLECSLEMETQQAGLLEHGTMMGTAREFLVRRVLKSIIPPVVHIASGKVIDAQGKVSRQIDIILYDSRLPVFEVDKGIGIYPIEGVLGAIEVKSTMTKTSLNESLANVASVVDLTVGIETDNRWEDRVRHFMNQLEHSEQLARRRATLELIPAIHVFAFNSRARMRGLAKYVEEWFKESGSPAVGDGDCPVLPRTIIAGKTVGLLDDGFITLDPGEDIWAQWHQEEGNDVRHLMSFWDTQRRFGWLASSLLQSVSRRLGPDHASLGIRYDITRYLPLTSYFAIDMNRKQAWHLPWKPNSS